METYLVIIKPFSTQHGRIYGAFAPDIPGCAVTGTTIEQTLDLVRSSLRSAVKSMVSSGQMLPAPTSIAHAEEEYRFSIDNTEQEQILMALVPCTAFTPSRM